MTRGRTPRRLLRLSVVALGCTACEPRGPLASTSSEGHSGSGTLLPTGDAPPGASSGTTSTTSIVSATSATSATSTTATTSTDSTEGSSETTMSGTTGSTSSTSSTTIAEDSPKSCEDDTDWTAVTYALFVLKSPTYPSEFQGIKGGDETCKGEASGDPRLGCCYALLASEDSDPFVALFGRVKEGTVFAYVDNQTDPQPLADTLADLWNRKFPKNFNGFRTIEGKSPNTDAVVWTGIWDLDKPKTDSTCDEWTSASDAKSGGYGAPVLNNDNSWDDLWHLAYRNCLPENLKNMPQLLCLCRYYW